MECGSSGESRLRNQEPEQEVSFSETSFTDSFNEESLDINSMIVFYSLCTHFTFCIHIYINHRGKQ